MTFGGVVRWLKKDVGKDLLAWQLKVGTALSLWYLPLPGGQTCNATCQSPLPGCRMSTTVSLCTGWGLIENRKHKSPTPTAFWVGFAAATGLVLVRADGKLSQSGRYCSTASPAACKIDMVQHSKASIILTFQDSAS